MKWDDHDQDRNYCHGQARPAAVGHYHQQRLSVLLNIVILNHTAAIKDNTEGLQPAAAAATAINEQLCLLFAPIVNDN